MALPQEVLDRRKNLINKLITDFQGIKKEQLEDFKIRSIDAVHKAQEFSKFVISIQVALVALGMPLIASSEDVSKVYIFVAATVFFLNIIIGILLQRANISFEIDFNPKFLDETHNNINILVQRLIEMRNSTDALADPEFADKLYEIQNEAKWTKYNKGKFNWDILFYGIFILGLIFLWLSIIWSEIISKITL